MRCEDLTRELASPTGAHSPAELAGHLADCPCCAERARQADRFEQLWQATRPIEPSPLMMDALWASASAALEAQSAPSTLRLEGFTHRRGWLRPALLVAQAAAILIAVGFVWVRKNQVEPEQVVITPIKNVVPVPTQNPQPIQNSDLEAFALFKVAKLDIVVGVDESAFVRIPVDNKNPQVFISTVAPSPYSNALPTVTSFDLIRGLEVMAERPVVITSL
jgi:hypothetical protein